MSDNRGALIVFLVTAVIVVGIAFIGPMLMFPDPEKLVDEKRVMLAEKFNQLSQVCNEVTGGFLPGKKMNSIPEKLWLIDIYFRQDPGKVGYNTALLPVEFCNGYSGLKDDRLLIGHSRPYEIAADAFVRKNAGKYKDSSDELKSGLEALGKTRYMAFYMNNSVVFPHYSQSDKSFTGGGYRGTIYVFRLKDAEYFGSVNVAAYSTAEISFPGSNNPGDIMNNAMTDFRINIGDAIEKAVPLSSYNPILDEK